MDRILDKLRSLQSSSSSVFLSMGSIPCNVKLPLLEVTRVDTRYGPSVCVTIQLEDEAVKVFLPKRFAELTEEDIESMRTMKGLSMKTKRGDESSPVITFSCSDNECESRNNKEKKMVTCHLWDVLERQQYSTAQALQVHLVQVHNISPQDCLQLNNSLCAFRNFTARYDIHLHERDDESHKVSKLFPLQPNAMANVFWLYGMPSRFFITLTVEVARLNADDEFEFSMHRFHSVVSMAWAEGSIFYPLQTACTKISAPLEGYQERGFGLVVVYIQTCTITVGCFIPQIVGCASFVLPRELPSR